MKTAMITTALLAAVSSTLAARSNFKRALQPLEIKDFTGALYSQELPTSYSINFALNDPNTNVDTDCSAYWYDISFHPKYGTSNCTPSKEIHTN